MKQKKQKANDDEICGWVIQNDPTKYNKIFTPSPNKKTTVLPQLSVRRHQPSLKPSLSTQKQAKKPSTKKKIGSKRLKSQIFHSYHPAPPLTEEERSPARLFPSLPMLSSAQLSNVYSTQPSQRRQTIQPSHTRFVKYHEMEEESHFKIIQKKLGMDKQRKEQKQQQNPEVMLTKRQSKQNLKMSTIEIVSKQLEQSHRIKDHQQISEIKQVTPVKKGKKGKAISKLKFNNEDNHIDEEFKQAKMLKLSIKNEAQFSDNIIFTKHSPSSKCLQAQPKKYRLIIKLQ